MFIRHFSAALLTVAGLTSHAADWPRWRGPGNDGVVPAGQPTARAMFTVGIVSAFALGSSGFGPYPSWAGNLALSPQPASVRAAIVTIRMVRIGTYPGWTTKALQ